MNLVVMPYLDCADLTRLAVDDCLQQTCDPPTTLLLIDNGSQEAGRELGLELARLHPTRVLRWRHDPPLLSLSAVWNRALQFAWEAGCDEALVVNNDVRVWEGTYEYLARVRRFRDALFVSATGVTPAQYQDFLDEGHGVGSGLLPDAMSPVYPLPGPDFSCYLITKACHAQYPFDEGYIPAYCEDLDYHRRLMLGGDGARVFGTGLPFLHVGSGTLNGASAEKRARIQLQIEHGSRAHHLAKWDGVANQERFTVPFEGASAREDVTTPDLFERVRRGFPAL